MHSTAEEAIALLNKIKWANTEADERLRLLEKIHKKVMEELEDLGVEEAEMKNMKVGTTDNLYNADACRLTAVVPIAFVISNALELYRQNLRGKTLDPVRVEKVKEHAVDMIDFGTKPFNGEGETEDRTGSNKSDDRKINGGEKDDAEAEESAESDSKEALGKEANNDEKACENEENNQQIPKPDNKTEEIPSQMPSEAPPPPPSDDPPEISSETSNGTNGDAPPSPPDGQPSTPNSDEIPEMPSMAPPQPPAEDPPTPPEEEPPVLPSDGMPEMPSEAPPPPPAEDPPTPPVDSVPNPPEEEPPIPPSDETPQMPSDDPPPPPTEAPPSPPNAPPEPSTTEDEEQESSARNGVLKETKPLENGGKMGRNINNDDKEVATNAKRGIASKEDEMDEEHSRKIKIEFEEHDEFAKLADEDYVPYHDILVSPRTWNEKGYFNARQERIRVTGDPEHRVGPYDRRDPKATAVLGASCYSAAAEILKATFLDGHVVVYKPHPYNSEADRIWAEVMKPLVEVGALSYCRADQGRELVSDPRIDQIYLTGSSETFAEVKRQSQKPCVFESGGVNPVILVPGLDRQWKPKELRHHALQIVSAGKFNGGHFCGRPQVIVTSKSWDQREEFLDALVAAIAERVPPEASYDPKYKITFERFLQEYPDGDIFEPENLDTDSARLLLVKGAAPDSYGTQHEAFCQVLIEVPLDVPDHPVTFLPEAVKYCNEKLHGSLCATIVVDDVVNKKYYGIVQQSLNDLNYGTVSTNAIACLGFFNPSLYWGNYKKRETDGKEVGVGHFGNLFGYENAVKSIITDTFIGSGHWIKTNRGPYNAKIVSLSHYAMEPSMKQVTAYKMRGVKAAAARKDF